MIKSLKIKNIALITESNINFNNGFNVLTGETGAGKSIIIDALNFVLGAKSDKSLIKNGEDFASVEAVFEVDDDEEINEILNDFNIEKDSIIKLFRSYNLSNKNDCKINGEVVSLSMLKKISNALIDIFGQQDHQLLLNTFNHLILFDNYIKAHNKNFNNILLELKEEQSKLHSINLDLKKLGGSEENRANEIELLKFQITEIENAKIFESEEEDLLNRKKILQNGEKIYNSLANSENSIKNSNIISSLKEVESYLRGICEYDENINNSYNKVSSLKFEISDVLDNIVNIKNSINYSEYELNVIEERLQFIKDLKRKYGNSIEKILEYLESSKIKLNELLNCNEKVNELNILKNAELENILKIVDKITDVRDEYADKLRNSIIAELRDLSMKNADFMVKITKDYNISNIESLFNEKGANNIEFLFSANLGEPVKSLNKIISGGEMSRFMLALKCVIQTVSKNKTFVFDEIDAGIGGVVGTVVGKKIAKISKVNQVFCVTHLAQIATFGDTNFRVFKTEDNNETKSQVIELDNSNKITEIARMIGSIDTDEYAIMHAKELLIEAQNYKSKLI